MVLFIFIFVMLYVILNMNAWLDGWDGKLELGLVHMHIHNSIEIFMDYIPKRFVSMINQTQWL